MIVAKHCQRDELNGFRPLVNLFSNVLTFPQPPPPSVLLTMPGSSRDLHLPLCFLYRCFPLWFFLLSFFLFTCTKYTIDPTLIQTNKSTRTRTRALQTLSFRLTFSKDLHTQAQSCCLAHLLFTKCVILLLIEWPLKTKHHTKTVPDSKYLSSAVFHTHTHHLLFIHHTTTCIIILQLGEKAAFFLLSFLLL